MIGFTLKQNSNVIDKTWIILDTCSTHRMTKHLDYVEEVKNYAKHEELALFTNGGSLLFDQKWHMLTFACTCEQEFSRNNTIFKNM